MCTSLLFKDKHSYFLRNMDLDYSFNEQIIIVPRNYKLTFKRHNEINNHYAFLAIVKSKRLLPAWVENASAVALSFKYTLEAPPQKETNRVIGICSSLAKRFKYMAFE